MIESSEFWAGIIGVVVGGVVTTLGHLIVHHWQTAAARKRDVAERRHDRWPVGTDGRDVHRALGQALGRLCQRHQSQGLDL